MKSVFVEAASVAKAIEKGWEKAGQPRKFSVTILERPVKNFLGMTKKPAKIGIFFDDKEGTPRQTSTQKERPRTPYRRPSRPQQRRGQRSRQPYKPQDDPQDKK